MAQQATCHTCIYAHWDVGLRVRTLWSGFPARPTCANQADSFGRMKEWPLGPACRNYRARPPTPTGENVKMIPLTGGYYAYVDEADFEELKQWRWRVCNGYAARNEKHKLIFMHRQIMQTPKGMVVDHINGNGFDDTRANLCNVTHQENMCNQSKQAGRASIYRGVTRNEARGKSYARVWFMGGYLRLGRFADEPEAGRAYDWLAVGLFGESAWLNFPQEWPPERRAQVYAEAREKREALIAKAKAEKRKGKGRKRKGSVLLPAGGRKRRNGGSTPFAPLPARRRAVDRRRQPQPYPGSQPGVRRL